MPPFHRRTFTNKLTHAFTIAPTPSPPHTHAHLPLPNHLFQKANPDSPQGDPDTPPQKYFTIMVERIPGHLRSAAALYKFFEKLFPGKCFKRCSEIDVVLLSFDVKCVAVPLYNITRCTSLSHSHTQAHVHSLFSTSSTPLHYLSLLIPHPLPRPLTPRTCTCTRTHAIGEVYNVEIALDLKKLNSMTRQRQSVRDSLEKAIAYYEATNIRPEVFIQTGKVRLITSLCNR